LIDAPTEHYIQQLIKDQGNLIEQVHALKERVCKLEGYVENLQKRMLDVESPSDEETANASPLCDPELRDYFAGQALVYMAGSGDQPPSIARNCYEIADAMLKERVR